MREARRGVSIPFIAGQWSLRVRGESAPSPNPVSIPFIAGQWSLPLAERRGGKGGRNVSIPFIAGQWSLLAARRVGKEDA